MERDSLGQLCWGGIPASAVRELVGLGVGGGTKSLELQ